MKQILDSINKPKISARKGFKSKIDTELPKEHKTLIRQLKNALKRYKSETEQQKEFSVLSLSGLSVACNFIFLFMYDINMTVLKINIIVCVMLNTFNGNGINIMSIVHAVSATNFIPVKRSIDSLVRDGIIVCRPGDTYGRRFVLSVQSIERMLSLLDELKDNDTV